MLILSLERPRGLGMSAFKPEDIVFSFKKPYLLAYSFFLISLRSPFGYEQVDSRERPALFLTKKKQFLSTEKMQKATEINFKCSQAYSRETNNLLAKLITESSRYIILI